MKPLAPLYRAALGRCEELADLDEEEWAVLCANAAGEGLEGLVYQRCSVAGLILPERAEGLPLCAYIE